MNDTLDQDVVIDSVYFAQTHIMETHHPYFKLTGGRATLIKVHALSPSGIKAPKVTAEFALEDESIVFELEGPTALPKSFCKDPGKLKHTFDDCFTTMVPGKWIAKGVKVTVRAGEAEKVFDPLLVGRQTEMKMTMFDVHYFGYADKEYPEDWAMELAVKWPVKSLEVQKLKRIHFPKVIIPPREGVPGILCASEEDYESQSGIKFNGKQGAALNWQKALRDAGGQKYLSLNLVNIANVKAGGFAESQDFGGCGALGRFKVLHHELGHALDVEDLNEEVLYPYRESMHGVDKTTSGGYHIGPTWGFDPRIGLPGVEEGKPFLIPSKNPENTQFGKPGEWKASPVMGGGGPGAEPGIPLKIYSDWSVRKMQEYLEKWIIAWNDEKQRWEHWNGWHQVFFRHPHKVDGVFFPVEQDVKVYSIMAAISAAKEDCNYIYPVIGPYTSGLIDTFDPSVAEDRAKVRRLTSISGPWDISLRVVQGGVTKTIMMPMQWDEDFGPRDGRAYQTRAVNLPVRDGEIEKIELLLTPDAAIDGLPENPKVLYTRDGKDLTPQGTPEHFDCDLSKTPLTWAFSGKTPPDYSKF